MTILKPFMSVAAAGGIVTSALVLAIPPAAQAQGVGSGRAVIRLDAPTATVIKTGKHSYRMILPPGTTGQWMGERTDTQGRTKVRIGDMTAKKLSNRWGNFRYAKSGAYATLVWGAQPTAETSAVLSLSEPTVTEAGVRFDFTSVKAIPSAMTNVTLNIARAPRAGRSSAPPEGLVTGQLYVSATYSSSPNQAKLTIYNVGNSTPPCWSATATVSGSYSVPSGNCAGHSYANWYSGYGVSVALPPPGKSGSALFSLNIDKAFQWNHSFTL